MAGRVGSDRRIQTESPSQILQTIIKSTKSTLVFPVSFFILPFLITGQDIKQIIRTIGSGSMVVSKSVNHLLRGIQHFHTDRSFRLDTVVPQYVPV